MASSRTLFVEGYGVVETTDDLDGLFVEVYSKLLGWFVNRTDHFETAEDLTQATYVKLKRQKPPLGFSSSYVFTAARTVLIDHVRSQVHRQFVSLTDQVVTFHGLQDHTRNDPSRADFDLEAAIKRMPLRHRLALELFDLYGFDHEEVATLLGFSRQASKSTVVRARRSLKAILTGQARTARGDGGQLSATGDRPGQ